jgi:Zn-dependent peptidase ImmA (M78 family)
MELWEFPHEMIRCIEGKVRDQVLRVIRENRSVIDPFEIAKWLKVDVLFTHTYNAPAFTIPSLSEDNEYKYTMFISKDVDRYSQKILCYHELGHIVCEGKPGPCLFDHTIDPESEFIANYFAAGFLPIFSRVKFSKNTTLEEVNAYVSSLIVSKENREIDIM